MEPIDGEMPVVDYRTIAQAQSQQIATLQARVKELEGALDEVTQLYEAGKAQWNPVYEIVLTEKRALEAQLRQRDAEIVTLANQANEADRQRNQAIARLEAERDKAKGKGGLR